MVWALKALILCRRELKRDVERYDHDPTPITQGHVNYAWDPQWDVRWDARLPWGDQRSESYRVYQLQAWGRWIWLAADLVSNGMHPMLSMRVAL